MASYQRMLKGTTKIDSIKNKFIQSINNEDQYELSDIFESVNHQNIKRVVEENIKYILKREGLWSPSFNIVIPEGGYEYQLGEVRFSGNFEIFDGHSNIIAYGSVVAQGQTDEIMTVEINITSIIGSSAHQEKLIFF